jgi:hypothetical protein
MVHGEGSVLDVDGAAANIGALRARFKPPSPRRSRTTFEAAFRAFDRPRRVYRPQDVL